MNLNINFPSDMFTEKTIQLNDIPCVCKVMLNGDFHVAFSEPLFDVSGSIDDFDKRDLFNRFPVLTGSAVAQYCNSMIGLKRIDDAEYRVLSLKFFHRLAGWVSLVEGGEFVPLNESEDGDY